jgi:hypothetical protein
MQYDTRGELTRLKVAVLNSEDSSTSSSFMTLLPVFRRVHNVVENNAPISLTSPCLSVSQYSKSNVLQLIAKLILFTSVYLSSTVHYTGLARYGMEIQE